MLWLFVRKSLKSAKQRAALALSFVVVTVGGYFAARYVLSFILQYKHYVDAVAPVILCLCVPALVLMALCEGDNWEYFKAKYSEAETACLDRYRARKNND
jgi:hypothetical protein